MRKRKWLFIVFLTFAMCTSIYGCKSDKKESPKEQLSTTENAESSQKETESTADTDNGVENNGDVTDSINIERDERADGSIFIKVTDRDGKLLQTVEYSVSNNNTIKYAYEYNERGVLITEYDYEGPGNLVEEFLDGNYDNATIMGENSHNPSGGYDVDMGAAFEVTILELEPLYKKAEEIWDQYGVAVLIADKVSSYTSSAELCYDFTKIKNTIELIEKCLQCYPKDFFRNFSGEFVETTVCIQVVGTGGPAGVYFDGDEFKIVQIDVNDYNPEESPDDNGSFLCYTLHHEIGHMISYTLLDRADIAMFPLMEERWNSYNPDGFNYVGYYDDDKENELFSSNDNSEYFVYSYSCSTPEEDRAIIFGKAMSYYQGFECMGFNENIEAKLIYLSDCIKSGFPGIDWSEKPVWENILDHEDNY